jgi:hypothetical protein
MRYRNASSIPGFELKLRHFWIMTESQLREDESGIGRDEAAGIKEGRLGQ